MTTPKPQCPRCRAAQYDWMLCAKCVAMVVHDLGRIPTLYRDLQDTITGQARMGDGGRSSDTVLPFNERAADAGRYVQAKLLTFVGELDMGDTTWIVETCTCAPYAACRGGETVRLATDSVRAMCRWLADRTERIRSQQHADLIADEIDYCVKKMLRSIDRPADLEFVGKCVICDGDLFAKHGDAEGACRRCRTAGVTTTYDPAARRGEILAQLEHHWGTVTDCTRVLLNYGLDVSVQTIKDWRRPNRHGVMRLVERGHNSEGHALYRFGDVMDLAKERVEQRRNRAPR